LLCSNAAEALHDPVPYREYILNGAVQVRESCQVRAGEVFRRLQTVCLIASALAKRAAFSVAGALAHTSTACLRATPSTACRTP
jgi:hypothetical protein